MKKSFPLVLISLFLGLFGLILFLISPLDFPSKFDLQSYNFWASFESPLWFHLHRFISFFGDSLFIFPVTFSIMILLIKRNYILEGFLYATFIGMGLQINASLKVYFSRLRPTPLIDDIWHSYSFPSGHTLGGLIFFISSTWILLSLYPQFQKYKSKIWITSSILFIWIGITRMALGAHWLTDVLSGFLIGGTMICLAKIFIENKKYFKFDHEK